MAKTRKSAIGIKRAPIKYTATERADLALEFSQCAIDCLQLARAIQGSEYARAKKNQTAVIKRLGKIGI